jgi:hypothetical protein
MQRRTFLGLTGGVLTMPAAALGRPTPTPVAETVVPGRWSNAVIVNALGGVEDPNPDANGKELNDEWKHDSRAMRDAQASGLTEPSRLSTTSRPTWTLSRKRSSADARLV